MSNSTPRKARAKSPRKKPVRTKFPLWLHSGSGQWAKKVRGRTYYFGTDPDAALAEYLRVKDDLEAGRTPKPVDLAEGVTLKALCNRFLTDKAALRDSGEITPRTFGDYYRTCELMLDRLGKTVLVDQLRPDDLMQLRRWLSGRVGTTTLGNEVNRIRVVLRYAFESGLTDRPVRFGNFKRPAKHVLRREKAANGPRLFEPDLLRKLLHAAPVQLRVMILLAINAGMGNMDCARLQFRNLDMDARWLDYPRPKTGVERRCPLWPETVAGLQSYLEVRKTPKDAQHKDLVFVTRCRAPWTIDTSTRNPISAEFRKLLNDLEAYRPGLSFYTLRHTFQTIADETGDYLATRRIMGHADDSMSGVYRERFPDERLRRVVEHVHGWLFGKEVQQ